VAPDDVPSVRLKLALPDPRDSDQPIARVGRTVLKALALADGSLIEVAGARSALLRARPAHIEDEGLDIVRIDVRRFPVGAEPGEQVTVRPADVPPARRLALASSDPIGQERLSPERCREALLEQVVLPGDVIRLDSPGTGFGGHVTLLGLDLLGVEGRASAEAPLILKVAATDPDGPVRVTGRTLIDITSSSATP
jgi:hypothetical protein